MLEETSRRSVHKSVRERGRVFISKETSDLCGCVYGSSEKEREKKGREWVGMRVVAVVEKLTDRTKMQTSE